MNNTYRGFTLIEVMIVIAIIWILFVSLMPALTSYIARSRDTVRVTDIDNLTKVMNLYFSDNEKYPPSDMSGCVDVIVIQKYNEWWKAIFDPLSHHNNGCNTNGHYAYAMGTGMLWNQHAFSFMSIMELNTTWNYNGSIEWFTWVLTSSAYYTGMNLLERWVGYYYIRVQ